MGRYNNTTAAMTLMVLVGLGVSACSSDNDSSSQAPSVEVADAPTAEPDGGTASEVTSGGDTADAQASGVPSGTSSLLTPGQALAIRAGVTVGTSNVRRAVDDTLIAVQRNNASIFTADVNIGDEREDGSIDGAGYFVVQVPPADLEPLIADLGATVGTVTGRTQDSADVTDQLVDLDIRIGVERNVIERFETLLSDANEFQDIVEIERVISERTIALEQLLASQRNLENRVEFSTLTIELQYVAPPIEFAEAESNDGIADAWRAGWDVFVGALFAIGFALAVAAPFLVTAGVLFGLVWLIGRRRMTTVTRPAPQDLMPEDEHVLAAPTPKE